MDLKVKFIYITSSQIFISPSLIGDFLCTNCFMRQCLIVRRHFGEQFKDRGNNYPVQRKIIAWGKKLNSVVPRVEPFEIRP